MTKHVARARNWVTPRSSLSTATTNSALLASCSYSLAPRMPSP